MREHHFHRPSNKLLRKPNLFPSGTYKGFCWCIIRPRTRVLKHCEYLNLLNRCDSVLFVTWRLRKKKTKAIIKQGTCTNRLILYMHNIYRYSAIPDLALTRLGINLWGFIPSLACLTTCAVPINIENKTDILAKLTLYYYLITSYKEHYTDK